MKTPTKLNNPDFKDLAKICVEYVRSKNPDEDLKEYIFEAALEAVYGKDIWKYINEKVN